MSVTQLTKANFDDTIAAGTVLVDFWAAWCGPCRLQSPVVDEFAGKHPEVKVGKVNVDEEPELAMRFQVMSIPTLIVFKNGKVATKHVSLCPLEEIEEICK